MGETVSFLVAAAVGTVVGAMVSLVPALHVYNVAALLLLVPAVLGDLMSPELVAFSFVGMTAGYAMSNAVSGIFFSAPDDSTIFVVLPGQKYMLRGRGYEAVMLTGLGGLAGIAVLAALTPLSPTLFPALRAILQPHLHWILWSVIAYMLLSEWPKGSGRAPAGLRRWWDGWKSLAAGLIAFLLSGILGFILLARSLVPVTVAYQNMLPAFVGLFAVPWVLHNILSQVTLPEQYIARTLDATPALLLRGTFAGVLGGLFAAFFPVVTGGIGGFIAGHATAQRDDRLFLISQGASKAVYYVGSLLFFFVPGLHLTRGGMAWMLSSFWSSYTPQTYYLTTAAAVLSGTISFLFLPVLARLVIKLTGKVDYRWINLGTLMVLLVIVTGTTGWGGLLICSVATGIGLIPVLWGSRRTNCMGVLLLPIALDMVGLGGIVTQWLGLVK